jgi:alpha-N-arabinofuranosidase
VAEATSWEESDLDITAKTNIKRDSLSIYVVNLNDSSQSAIINIAGFKFSTEVTTWIIGDCDLNTLNTASTKEAVAPKTEVAFISKKDSICTFPRYSYTVITLKKQ